MFLLKACPRCHGDLYFDGNPYDSFLRCIQCGYTRDIQAKNVPIGAVALPGQQTSHSVDKTKRSRQKTVQTA